MRFVADGPDIPPLLVKRWRDGDVVFLAGAGISMPAPANLPSFQQLVLDVYGHLSDPLAPILQDLRRTPSRKKQLFRSARLQAREQVEANLFMDGQFDRLFSAFEARIDQDARGRPIARRVRDAVEVRLRGAQRPAASHRDLVRLSLAPRAAHQLGSGAQCRIVTTNFDLLLEQAWGEELGTPGIRYDVRMAPRPGAHNFEGVLHLHGSLNPNPAESADFVLNSRDFARLYLRAGVVANYVYDLVRRYTVVLVGYSLEDPTMRYLMDAIGEDASLFDDMNRVYAIAAHSRADHDGEITAQTWRAKNIEPILYKERKRAAHAPLWETIHAWADWARGGRRWAEAQLLKLTASAPDIEDDFRTSFVRELLQVLSINEREDAVRRLSAARAPFSWIETIDAATSPRVSP